MNTGFKSIRSVELMVANLTACTSESQVEAFFQHFGCVSHLRLIRNRATGRSRGHAFISLNYGSSHGLTLPRSLVLNGSSLVLSILAHSERPVNIPKRT